MVEECVEGLILYGEVFSGVLWSGEIIFVCGRCLFKASGLVFVHPFINYCCLLAIYRYPRGFDYRSELDAALIVRCAAELKGRLVVFILDGVEVLLCPVLVLFVAGGFGPVRVDFVFLISGHFWCVVFGLLFP